MILLTTYCYKLTQSLYIKGILDLNDRVYKSISQLNPESMWFYFGYKHMPYSLREGLTIGLPKTHSFHFTIVQMQLLPVVLSYDGIIFLKSSDSLLEFKNTIKYIGNIDC